MQNLPHNRFAKGGDLVTHADVIRAIARRDVDDDQVGYAYDRLEQWLADCLLIAQSTMNRRGDEILDPHNVVEALCAEHPENQGAHLDWAAQIYADEVIS